MAIPEKIEFLEKGDEVKAKSPVPCNIRINDVEKSPFQKIGKVFVKQGKEPFCDRR
jgi:hypothetical protein